MKATPDLNLPTVRIMGHEVPVIDSIHRRLYKAASRTSRSLNMAWWHGRVYGTRTESAQCGTTHCRAGWAVHLAGKQGYDLEDRLGDAGLAGKLIYEASGHKERVNFFEDEAPALRDMKRLAREEHKAAVAKLKQQRAEQAALRP